MGHSIKLPRTKRNRRSVDWHLNKYGLKIGHMKQALMQAAVMSEKMSAECHKILRHVYLLKGGSSVENFNKSPILVRWFGKAEKANDVKDVYNRTKSIQKRISKGLTIKIRPQKEKPGNARNHGGFLDPKTFRVFPRMFEKFLDENHHNRIEIIAAIYIHEMMHLWFKDQKLDGEKVYGEDLALKLAKRDPKKARKSAENYEHFARELYAG